MTCGRCRCSARMRTSEEQLGLYIEPVQLQVVCRRLWSSLERADNEIGLDDLER